MTRTGNAAAVDEDRHNPSQYSSGLSSLDLRMLASIRHGLQNSVSAEVSSELAKTICEFSVAFLDRLLVKYVEWPQILSEQVARQAQVLRSSADLLAAAGASDPAILDRARLIANEAFGTGAGSLQDVEERQRKIDSMLEQVIPALLRDERLLTAHTAPQVETLLREQIAAIADSEQAFNAAIKARVQRHDALVGSRIAVTRDKVQEYLRARLPERKQLEITSFDELVGGSSKATVLMDVRGFEHDGITQLVVRLDREAGTTDTHVVDEVPTLRAMFARGFPAPEVVLVEPDASQLGVAFIIVRKIDAKLGGGMWHADPQLCDADTARDLARLLARLHTLDATSLGLRGALNSDPSVHPMKGLIDHARQLWMSKRFDPDGTMEACLSWLERHMPPTPARLSLIHADVAFHNILVRDKKIAGLLDWELSHLGDPIEDLSYSRLCIEQLIPWEDFLAEYRAHGGGAYSEETGRYYGIWRGVRNAIYAITGQHSFHTGANPDMRWGFFATYYRLLLLEACDKISAAGVKRSV